MTQGWLGKKCPECKGTGEGKDTRSCPACAGTGEAYGELEDNSTAIKEPPRDD